MTTWAFPARVHPAAGKFYRARNGQVWCCFRARPLVKDYGTHTQAMCIRVKDYKINYYLDDTSCDEGGEVEDDDMLLEQVDEDQVTQDWIAESADRRAAIGLR